MTDPHLFSGVGNAYSDEILHRARLSPFKQTRQLTETEAERLHAATVETLVEWTKKLQEEAEGKFPEKVTAFHDGMAVHGRFGKPCPRCATPVQRIVHGEHEANYCPTCQTEGRLLADRALSKLLREDWPKTVDEMERQETAVRLKPDLCHRLEADRQPERRANRLDIRIAIGTRNSRVREVNHFECRDRLQPAVELHRDAAASCRKVIESGSARGCCNRRVRYADVELQEERGGASSIHSATQARRHGQHSRIVPALRDVEQPLASRRGRSLSGT